MRKLSYTVKSFFLKQFEGYLLLLGLFRVTVIHFSCEVCVPPTFSCGNDWLSGFSIRKPPDRSPQKHRKRCLFCSDTCKASPRSFSCDWRTSLNPSLLRHSRATNEESKTNHPTKQQQQQKINKKPQQPKVGVVLNTSFVIPFTSWHDNSGWVSAPYKIILNFIHQ